MAVCLPFLEAQIKAIEPRIIVTLGRVAAQTLLDTQASLSSLRGTFHNYKGISLMPTYHPAYLLRNPAGKRAVWEDVQKVRDVVLGKLKLQIVRVDGQPVKGGSATAK